MNELAEPGTAAPATPTGAGHDPSLIAAVGPTYFPIAFVARLPFAMMVVGVLTLVVSARHSMSLAGLDSAMVGAGSALFGSAIGAAVDRFGQRRVVLATAIANSLALLAMSIVVYGPLPDIAVLGVAFAIGATAPQVSPLSRSRLVSIIGRRLAAGRRGRALNGTMAYESAADEVIFIIGPFLVGVLATTVNPAAPIVGAGVLTAIFVGAFALHRTAQAPSRPLGERPVAPAPTRELWRPELVTVLLGVLGMGLYFGTTLTGLTAFMDDRGLAARAGLVYGVMGIGSAALALSVALFPEGFTRQARWISFGCVLLAGTVLFPWVSSVAAMCGALFIAGIGIGPTLVTHYSLASMRSPVGRSATVMTMLGSAIIVGQSGSSAISGLLSQDAGTHLALFLPMGAAALVIASGVADLINSRRRPASTRSHPA